MNRGNVQMKEKRDFWFFVEKRGGGDCWPWHGSFSSAGRALFYWRGHLHMAHRVAWMLTHGEIEEGIPVKRTCNNLACCNPAHLYRATALPYVPKEHYERGETPDELLHAIMPEERRGKKLTSAQVLEMRQFYKAGECFLFLARTRLWHQHRACATHYKRRIMETITRKCKECGQEFSIKIYDPHRIPSPNDVYCTPCFACRTFREEHNYRLGERYFQQARNNKTLTAFHKGEYVYLLKGCLGYTKHRIELRACYDELVSFYKDATGETWK
jgi:hypothetical protein